MAAAIDFAVDRGPAASSGWWAGRSAPSWRCAGAATRPCEGAILLSPPLRRAGDADLDALGGLGQAAAGAGPGARRLPAARRGQAPVRPGAAGRGGRRSTGPSTCGWGSRYVADRAERDRAPGQPGRLAAADRPWTGYRQPLERGLHREPVRPDRQEGVRHRGLPRHRPGRSRSRSPRRAPTWRSSRAARTAWPRPRADDRGVGRKAVVIPADVTSEEAVDGAVGAAIEQLGHVDIVVNNAGGVQLHGRRSATCGCPAGTSSCGST